MEDISKIPRLPGDGAQDEPLPDSNFDEAPDKTQIGYCRSSSNALQNKLPDSAQSKIGGKLVFGPSMYEKN